MKGQVDLLKNEVRDKELIESALEDMGGELEGVQAALVAAFEQCVLQLHANAIREAEQQKEQKGERDQETNELKVAQQELNRRDLMFLCEQIGKLQIPFLLCMIETAFGPMPVTLHLRMSSLWVHSNPMFPQML